MDVTSGGIACYENAQLFYVLFPKEEVSSNNKKFLRCGLQELIIELIAQGLIKTFVISSNKSKTGWFWLGSKLISTGMKLTKEEEEMQKNRQ